LLGLVVGAPLIGATIGAIVEGAGTTVSVSAGIGNDFVKEVRGTTMMVPIASGKQRAGAGSELDRTYRGNVIKGKTGKRLRGRLLVQDSGATDTGLVMALWDNLADMQTYEPSVLYKEIMAQLPPLFVGEYKTYRCEAKYIDMVS
jgi:hypothetical protein